MWKRALQDHQLTYQCMSCGETFKFRNEVEKHQDPLLRLCRKRPLERPPLTT